MENEQEKLDPRVEFSRKIQEFKLSDYYRLLADKLAIDYKRLVNDLIVKEGADIRGQLQYVISLFDWLESKSELEEMVNLEKRKIEEDKDW